MDMDVICTFLPEKGCQLVQIGIGNVLLHLISETIFFCAALRSIWFKMLSAFITKPIHHISGYASKVMLSLEKVWKQCKAFNKPFAEESLGFGLVLHVV